MIVKLALTIDPAAEHKAPLIVELSENLRNHFQNREYGKDVIEILIGIKCVNPPIGFEDVIKVQKPYYIKYKEVKNKYTGEIIKIDKQIGYDLKISGESFNMFIISNKEHSLDILKSLILNSTSILKSFPSKIKDFDFSAFEQDLNDFFNQIHKE